MKTRKGPSSLNSGQVQLFAKRKTFLRRGTLLLPHLFCTRSQTRAEPSFSNRLNHRPTIRSIPKTPFLPTFLIVLDGLRFFSGLVTALPRRSVIYPFSWLSNISTTKRRKPNQHQSWCQSLSFKFTKEKNHWICWKHSSSAPFGNAYSYRRRKRKSYKETLYKRILFGRSFTEASHRLCARRPMRRHNCADTNS